MCSRMPSPRSTAQTHAAVLVNSSRVVRWMQSCRPLSHRPAWCRQAWPGPSRARRVEVFDPRCLTAASGRCTPRSPHRHNAGRLGNRIAAEVVGRCLTVRGRGQETAWPIPDSRFRQQILGCNVAYLYGNPYDRFGLYTLTVNGVVRHLLARYPSTQHPLTPEMA
jgi:hypothetical protein